MNDDMLLLLIIIIIIIISGIGHVLNSHLILDKLDKYTLAVQSILGDIRGLGAVPLTSTCPECLMNTSATRKGEATVLKCYAAAVVHRSITSTHYPHIPHKLLLLLLLLFVLP